MAQKPELVRAAATTPEGEKSWTWSYGVRPHTVYARELRDKGGVIQVRFTDPTKPGRDKRVRLHLHLPLRTPNGTIDPKCERAVKMELMAMNANLVRGEPVREAPAIDTSEEPGTPETLTLRDGFELPLHPETGKYATTESRRYGDMCKYRDILLGPGMLDPRTRWVDISHDHAVKVWRKMADVHKGDPKRYGPRLAEQVVDALFTVGAWLRKKNRIPAKAAMPPKGWRTDLKEEWTARTGTTVEVTKERHSEAEMLAIFGAMWDPRRELYRALLPVVKDGALRAVRSARFSNIVWQGDCPVALRVRYLRRKRKGGEREVSARLHLTGAPQQALVNALRRGFLATAERARRTGECSDYALFPDATEALLTIDPRTELAVELGAELRLGQVLRAMRSDFDPTSTALAPYGKLRVRGRGKKAGETVVLTAEQRAALDRSLAGYLSELEAQYDPEHKKTDYCLFVAGVLAGGRQSLVRNRSSPSRAPRPSRTFTPSSASPASNPSPAAGGTDSARRDGRRARVHLGHARAQRARRMDARLDDARGHLPGP